MSLSDLSNVSERMAQSVCTRHPLQKYAKNLEKKTEYRKNEEKARSGCREDEVASYCTASNRNTIKRSVIPLEEWEWLNA
jgi:hypothetical protein